MAMARLMRQIQKQASQEGRGEAVLVAFRQIVHRLRHNPLGLGEPLFNLPALRLQIRCVVGRPLVVDFAVNKDHFLVFIKGIKMLGM